MKTATRLAGLAAVAALTLTACGGEDPSPEEPAGGAWDGEGTTTAPASASTSPDPSDGSEGSEDSAGAGEDGSSPSEASDPPSPSEEGSASGEGSEDPSAGTGSSPEAGDGPGEGTDPGEGPSSFPSPSAAEGSTRMSAAGREQQARLEEMAPSILLAEDLPGDVLVGEQRRATVDSRFELNMSVRGVEAQGECRRLITRIDTFSRPGSAVGFSQYEVDPDAEGTIGEPEAFAAAVITRYEEDVMGMFGQLPEVCGELSGPDATAVFEPVEGLPGASRLVMESDGERIELLMGGVSDGDEHLYTGYVNIETELAEQMLREQVAAFEDRER